MEFSIKFKSCLLVAVFLIILAIARDPSHCGAVEVFNITCEPDINKIDCQSESLEDIAEIILMNKTISDLEIRLQIRHLRLSGTLNFTNLRSLVIRGDHESTEMTKIICSHHSENSRAGIVLSDIRERLLLQNLNLIFCGSIVFSKTEEVDSEVFFSLLYSALTITHCKNVEIVNFVVERSEGLGLVMNSTRGDYITITSATFKENKISPGPGIKGEIKGGGGAYILVNPSSNREDQLSATKLTMLRFRNCTFDSNTARTQYYKFIDNDAMGELVTGYGRGGGAFVFLSTGVRNAHVSFSDCKFLSNRAFLGGGLAIIVQGQDNCRTTNVSVVITNTHFQQNGNDEKGNHHTGLGGGLHIAFHASDLQHVGGISDSHVHLHGVSFSNNSAELGGAVFYISYRAKHENFSYVNSMLFEDCVFEYNRGHVGSAVAMTPYLFRKLSSGFIVIPKFKNCIFSSNAVYRKTSHDSHAQRIAGIGTIYASFYDIHFEGCNTFHGNLGTAIYVVNGILNFTNSDASFFNNTGINGGALGLVGSSISILCPSRRYDFVNNTAWYQGGAIYVSLMDTIDFISSRTCFIQYHGTHPKVCDRNTNVNFVGNRAQSELAGHAIYATSTRPCQVIQKSGYTLINASAVFGFDFNGDAASQIATDGAELNSTKPSPLLIIPGQKYEHGVVITDDLGHRVKASFRVFMSYENSEGIELESTSAYIGKKIQLRGRPHSSTTLHLQAVSPRQNYIKLNVTLLDCPPGFKFNNKSSKCVCGADTYVSLIRCDLDTFHSYILPGFWIGLIKTSNRTDLVTGRCVFCDHSKQISEFGVVLPQNFSGLNKAVCGDTRTGIICGRCRDGYTVHFHSPGFLCKPAEPLGCRLGWLFYILSELVPVTVVFITVLLLNISFTSGAVNGFILFSQLLDTFAIDASGVISYPKSAKHTILAWIRGYRFIYGFFNLDFFDSESLSFCMRKNSSALDMLALKYVTIFYTLLLIVAVIWIMNKCGGRCCGRFCRITTVRTSVVHGISTFLVIGYAKCVKTSLDLLVPIWLRKSGFNPPARVRLNGELLYFSTEHLPYALPAIFCLLTIGLLPPALLLVYPLGNKIMTFFGCDQVKFIAYLSQFFSISSIKPLLDSIQGCFKDNMRFFAGLYFLYRWVIPLVHITANGFSTYCCALGGVLLFILTLHTICQPYTKKAHNVIDTLLFMNLILINSLSFFNYYKSHTQWGIRKGATVSPAIVQLVLIYLPLMVVGVYVLVIFLKKVAQLRYCVLLDKIMAVFAAQMKANTLRELIESTVSVLDEDSSKMEEEEIHNWLMDGEREFRNTNKYCASDNCGGKPLEAYI